MDQPHSEQVSISSPSLLTRRTPSSFKPEVIEVAPPPVSKELKKR